MCATLFSCCLKVNQAVQSTVGTTIRGLGYDGTIIMLPPTQEYDEKRLVSTLQPALTKPGTHRNIKRRRKLALATESSDRLKETTGGEFRVYLASRRLL